MKNTNISVKKRQSYWVLLLALVLGSTWNIVEAQPATTKVNSYIGAYANLGEWSLLPSQSNYSTSFGVAGGLGFLYELQVGPIYSTTRFLFDVGVGASGGMTSFMQGSDSKVTLSGQTDLQGDPFTYVYDLQNRRDRYNNIAVQVPLMIGVQHKQFYMLAGVKAGYNIWTKTNSTANLNTYGVYGNIIGATEIGDIRNEPDHQFFENYPLQKGVKTSLRLNLDVCFEIGGRIGMVYDAVGFDVPKPKVEYRLAAFVDYGVTDVHTRGTALALGTRDEQGNIVPIEGKLNYNQGSTYPVYQTESMVENIVVNDIMSTEGFAESVNNLMIGLKFTVLFQMPEAGQCVICRDGYRSLARRRGSRTGMKYEE